MTDASASSKWIVLAVAGSGVFMVTLDSGMVNVALPTVTQAYAAPVVTTQWVVLGYLLCITALLLPVGRLADMLGRKRIFLGGFVIFTVASGLCALAPSLGVLIALRVLQGVGGAMVQANSAGLITQAFPSSERGKALGMNGAIVSAGLLSGPVVGGLIIDWLGWQWVFLVNVPLGILATLFGLRMLHETPVRPGQRFDPAGAALFLVLVVGLLLTLNRGGEDGWMSPFVLALAAGTVAVAAVFAVVEQRVAQPTLEFALFRNASFRVAVLAAFLSFIGLASSQLLLPFYMQRVLGLAASQVGLVLVTIPATVLVLAPIAGALSDRFGSRLLASAGLLGSAGGLFSLATLGLDSSVLDIVVRLLVIAVGISCFNAPNSSALFGSLPRERYGVGGAYQSLTRNLGQGIGQTIAAALWTAVVVANAGGLPADAASPEALMAGFQVAFATAAAAVAIGAVISFVARPTATPTPEPVVTGAAPRPGSRGLGTED
jgi:EmrB/QacA subfamily drug resistance transporter